jgi:hypothetical protein
MASFGFAAANASARATAAASSGHAGLLTTRRASSRALDRGCPITSSARPRFGSGIFSPSAGVLYFDDQLDLRRLLKGQINWLLANEDTADIEAAWRTAAASVPEHSVYCNRCG